ncbi:MAG: hypothetical protein ACI4MF_01430 [Candidatus Faecivicinus sp.]
MKSLTTIQKTFRVFHILSKIAMILSFTGAALALTGMLCGIVWRGGGRVVGMDQEALIALTRTSGLERMIGELLCDAIFALVDGALFLHAFLYFRAELQAGTPFTHRGADRVKALGIRAIVLPPVAAIACASLCGWFNLPRAGSWSCGGFVALGVLLILASPVLRYGAELELQMKQEHSS